LLDCHCHSWGSPCNPQNRENSFLQVKKCLKDNYHYS
jgi:hypothetical protein